MKPPAFAYVAPDSLDEALALRREHAGDSAVLAGGQSLIPLLNLRFAHPMVVIDIGRVVALDGIRAFDGGIVIGAMTRQRAAEESAIVRNCAPLVGQALAHVGHVSIRNRGTVGGSLTHADPAAELLATALALDATLVAQSERGQRRIAASDFFLGALTTALEQDELLVTVEIPTLPAGAATAFVEVARRHHGYAVASAAAVLVLDAAGAIAEARLAVFGGGSTAVRAREAEAVLRSALPEPLVLREAAEVAAAHLDVGSDSLTPAHYRRRVAGIVASRALAMAVGASPSRGATA